MKKIIVNIPESASDVQVIKSRYWYLRYNTSAETTEKIMIDNPCEIINISKNDNKKCVEVNMYTTKEYTQL